MGCGGCGGEIFRLFTRDREVAILAECQGCKSVSAIKIEQPKLQIGWQARFDGEESDGRLSIGYDN